MISKHITHNGENYTVSASTFRELQQLEAHLMHQLTEIPGVRHLGTDNPINTAKKSKPVARRNTRNKKSE